MLVPLCIVQDVISAGGLQGFQRWLLHDKRPKLNKGVLIRTCILVAFLVGFMYARLSLQGGPAPVWYDDSHVHYRKSFMDTCVLDLCWFVCVCECVKCVNVRACTFVRHT